MSSLNPEEASSQTFALGGSRIQTPAVCFRHSIYGNHAPSFPNKFRRLKPAHPSLHRKNHVYLSQPQWVNFKQWRQGIKSNGFVVHCYADPRKDRLYLVGRLDDGRSFAAVDGKWRPSLHVFERDMDKVRATFSSLKHEAEPPTLESFDGGEKLLRLTFPRHRDYNAVRKRLEQAAVLSPDGDLKPPDAYFIPEWLLFPYTCRCRCPGSCLSFFLPIFASWVVSQKRIRATWLFPVSQCKRFSPRTNWRTVVREVFFLWHPRQECGAYS